MNCPKSMCYNGDICAMKQSHIAKLENQNNILNGKLTEAKEIIKKFSEFVNNKAEYEPEHPQEYTDLWYELCEEAEQFLKE